MNHSGSMAGMGSMGGGMDMGGGEGACKISMLWNWYTIDACFLAQGWHIRNKGMFAVTCIGVALMTVCLETLRRACREYDLFILGQWRSHANFVQNNHRRIAESSTTKGIGGDGDRADVDHEDEIASTPGSAAAGGVNVTKHLNAPQRSYLTFKPYVENSSSITFRATPIQQLIRAILHTMTFGLAYILMLLVMYFNGYIIISIILGAGVGKFVCDWMTSTIKIDTHCQGSNELSFGQRLRNNEDPAVCC